MNVFDERACYLGEGPLWHPGRQQVFWFDIMNRKLLSQVNGRGQEWSFPEYVSAAAWIDQQQLLISGENGLFRFNIGDGSMARVILIEADNPDTRSNDGRADPWGGFWVSTMGLNAQPEAGAIYRYYRGSVQKLFDRITIPNAICFSQDRRFAYFADSALRVVWRQNLDAENGRPSGSRQVFIDCSREGLNPDGAVIDAEGRFWCAQWGASRVACYSPEGEFLCSVELPTAHTSCPAFGGPELDRLFVTTARQELTPEQIHAQTDAGKTFVSGHDYFRKIEASLGSAVKGQAEYQVIL